MLVHRSPLTPPPLPSARRAARATSEPPALPFPLHTRKADDAVFPLVRAICRCLGERRTVVACAG